jgi:PAS domain S-box-containing protein
MPSQVLANPVPLADTLPDFDASGHLPVGIHSSTLQGLYRIVRFNEHRRKMWLQLSSFLVEPVLKHKFTAVYVGGGFISTKPDPSDIDLVLETASPYGPEAFESVAPFFVTGLDKIEMIYGVHLQFWMRGAPSGLSDYRTFFQYDRPSNFTHVLNRSRGIVRIDLTEPGTLNRLRRYIRGENTTAVPAMGALKSPTPADEIERLHGIKRTLGVMAVNAPRLIILADSQGNIEWVNECFIRSCGYSLDEARGQKPGKLLQGPASDRETVQRLRRAVAEVQECNCQLVNYRKDGTPYAVHIMLSPLFESGQLTGFIAVEEDLGPPESAPGLVETRQAAA